MTGEKRETGDEIRVGLWKKVSAKGVSYLNGNIEGYWVNYFKSVKEGQKSAGALKLYPKQDESGEGLTQITVWMQKRTSAAGMDYLSAITNDRRFTIFHNGKKTNPKAPDYNLIISHLKDDYQKIDASSTEQAEEPIDINFPAEPESVETEEDDVQDDTFDDDPIPF